MLIARSYKITSNNIHLQNKNIRFKDKVMSRSNIRYCTYLMILTITMSLFANCQKSYFYKQTHSFENKTWDAKEKIQFAVKINENTTPYRLIFEITNTNDYKNSNLWLFVQVKSPTGVLQKDTFECILSDTEGKWLGIKRGRKYILPLVYKENTYFKEQGNYLFEIQHGMREPVNNITDIGLCIEKMISK